jgi:hypothetical protein
MLIITIIDWGILISTRALRQHLVINPLILNIKDQGPERLSHLSKVTQLDSETAETKIRTPESQQQCFACYILMTPHTF